MSQRWKRVVDWECTFDLSDGQTYKYVDLDFLTSEL